MGPGPGQLCGNLCGEPQASTVFISLQVVLVQGVPPPGERARILLPPLSG